MSGLNRKKPLRADPEKTWEWKKRSRRNNQLKRTPLNPVKPERKKKRRERDFGDKAEWIRKQPCDQCGAPPPCDPSHYPSRGAGGTKRDLLPQCRACHDTLHQMGAERFQEHWDVDLSERTAFYEREWQAHREADGGDS